MKQKYTILLFFLFLQQLVIAQTIYDTTINTYCPLGYNLINPVLPSKTSVQMGTNFLVAGMVNCSGMDNVKVVEVFLMNSGGEADTSTKINYGISADFSLEDIRLFPHSSDTAWFVLVGNQYKIFKITKHLEIIPVLTDTAPPGKFEHIKEFANGNIGVVYNKGESSSSYKLFTKNGEFEISASPLAFEGFWISNFFTNKLLGHSLLNPDRFLEIRLDSQGVMVSDTFLMSSPQLLYPTMYRFSDPNQLGQKHLAIATKNKVSVYPVLGSSLGSIMLAQETFVEEDFVRIDEIKTLDSGEILVRANPESYLWSSSATLVTCIPSHAYYSKPGGSSAYIKNYYNQSLHISRKPNSFPANLAIHITGAILVGGAGWAGWPLMIRHSGYTCYPPLAGNGISLSGMPDTIKTIPFTGGRLSVTGLYSGPWDVQWIYNKKFKDVYFSGTIGNFSIHPEDTNGINDSFRVCVVAYIQGSTPFKSCQVSKIAKVKQPTTGLDSQEAEFASLLSIYPNPSNTLFNVSADPKLCGSKWDLYSSTGVLVQTGIIKTNSQLDLSLAPAGVYYMQVEASQSKFTYRLLKL